MPRPSMRRRPPSLVKVARLEKNAPPEWYLKRREDGWNSRFSIDGRSHLDGAIDGDSRELERLLESASCTSRDDARSDGSGGKTPREEDDGGRPGPKRGTRKRVRIRNIMGQLPRDSEFHKIHRMDKLDSDYELEEMKRGARPGQPLHTYKPIDAFSGQAVQSRGPCRTHPSAPLHPQNTNFAPLGQADSALPRDIRFETGAGVRVRFQGGEDLSEQYTRDAPDKVSPVFDVAKGETHPKAPRVKEKSGLGNSAVGVRSTDDCEAAAGNKAGKLNAGAAQEARRAAVGACMYREKLLARLRTLVNDWPSKETGTKSGTIKGFQPLVGSGKAVGVKQAGRDKQPTKRDFKKKHAGHEQSKTVSESLDAASESTRNESESTNNASESTKTVPEATKKASRSKKQSICSSSEAKIQRNRKAINGHAASSSKNLDAHRGRPWRRSVSMATVKAYRGPASLAANSFYFWAVPISGLTETASAGNHGPNRSGVSRSPPASPASESTMTVPGSTKNASDSIKKKEKKVVSPKAAFKAPVYEQQPDDGNNAVLSSKHLAATGARPKKGSTAESVMTSTGAPILPVAGRRENAARLLKCLARALRKAGLRCVEKIVAWSLIVSPDTSTTTPFPWNSNLSKISFNTQDYLAKMYSDLDFVKESLGSDAQSFGRGNPLLLTSSEASAGSIGESYLCKLSLATHVILDAVKFARGNANEPSAADARVASVGAGVGTGSADYGLEKTNSNGGIEEGGSSGREINEKPINPVAWDGAEEASPGVCGDDGGPAEEGAGQTPKELPVNAGSKSLETGGTVAGGKAAAARNTDSANSKGVDEGREGVASPVPVPSWVSGVSEQESEAAAGSEAVRPTALQEMEDRERGGGWREKKGEMVGGDGQERDPFDSPSAGGGARRQPAPLPPIVVADTSEVVKEGAQSPLSLSPSSPLAATENDRSDVREVEDHVGRSTEVADAGPYGAIRAGDSSQARVVDRAVGSPMTMTPGTIEGVIPGTFNEISLETAPEGGANKGARTISGKDDGGGDDVKKQAPPKLLETPGKGVEEGPEEGDGAMPREKSVEVEGTPEGDVPKVSTAAEAVTAAAEEALKGTSEEISEGDARSRGPGVGGRPTRIGAYDVECLLGDGAYGWVYRGRLPPGARGGGGGDRQQQQQQGQGHSIDDSGVETIVAIKQFKDLGLNERDDVRARDYLRCTQEREVELVLSLHHPHIVRCLGTLPATAARWVQREEGQRHGEGCEGSGEGEGSGVFIIFEHISGTLLDFIEGRPGGLSLREVTSLLEQLLSAVEFLHQNGVVHRDIKPENILVEKGQGTAAHLLKLCDLGTARKVNEVDTEADDRRRASLTKQQQQQQQQQQQEPNDGSTTAAREWTEYIGSRWYRAPEVLAGSTDYGTPADVWACACVAVEMSSGRPLFFGDDEGKLARSIAALLGPLPPTIAARLRKMGFMPPPPRGAPTRTLEACLDGSTGKTEARKKRGGQEIGPVEDGAASALRSLLSAMLEYDPSRRISAEYCLRQRDVFSRGSRAPTPGIFPSIEGNKGVTNDVGDTDTVGGVETAKDTASSVVAVTRDASAAKMKDQSPGCTAITGGTAKCAGVLPPQSSRGAEDQDASPQLAVKREIGACYEEGEKYSASDGWRVPEALRVLEASGPGGCMAREAVERLLQPPSVGHQVQARSVPSDVIRLLREGFEGGVREGLEEFSASVGGQGGLSDENLVRLAFGLARCVDAELREEAEVCQAWAARYRQGRRLAGGGGGSPLRECAEHVKKSLRCQAVGCRLAALALLALCSAADGGREVEIADTVHASSNLETLSRTICALTPCILDADHPRRERNKHLKTVVASITSLDEKFVEEALRSSLLSPAAQAVLLRAMLIEGGERRVTLVTTREEALDNIEVLLEREMGIDSSAGASVRGQDVDPSPSSGEPHSSSPRSTPSLMLNPYYLSPWGKKKVLGKRVEEGEGLGPRKELFELAARQLSARWQAVPQTTSPGSSSVVTATTLEGRAEVELASPAVDCPLLAEVVDGWKVVVGDQSRVISGVKLQRGDDGTVRVTARADKLWKEGFQFQEARLEKAFRPILVYRQGSESLWLDARASSSDQGHHRRLRTLGRLIALSVTNACQLPVELPDLFFRWILTDGTVNDFVPTVDDMISIDPSLTKPFEALENAARGDSALAELLEIEGLPGGTPVEEYITYMVKQTFLDPIGWQISEIREAFSRSLPLAQLERSSGKALPRPYVMAEIVRGPPPPRSSKRSLMLAEASGGKIKGRFTKEHEDFDFREVFTVYEDRELIACAPLREALWRVVQEELSAQERRRLALFITGTDFLPEKGCETLSIEIPFETPGGSSGKGKKETRAQWAEKALGTVPTAHTCDNVLEMPNYWSFLMQAEGLKGATASSRSVTATDMSQEKREALESRLRSVLAGRLRVAIENASGYALDDLDDGHDHHSESSFSTFTSPKQAEGLAGEAPSGPSTATSPRAVGDGHNGRTMHGNLAKEVSGRSRSSSGEGLLNIPSIDEPLNSARVSPDNERSGDPSGGGAGKQQEVLELENHGGAKTTGWGQRRR